MDGCWDIFTGVSVIATLVKAKSIMMNGHLWAAATIVRAGLPASAQEHCAVDPVSSLAYSFAQMRKVVSILLLAVWFVLAGIEFLEHAGLFIYSDDDIDSAVDAALVNLGAAVKISQDEQVIVLPPAVSSIGIFSSFLEHVPAFWLSFSSLKADFFKRAVPVYKLHRHFRI